MIASSVCGPALCRLSEKSFGWRRRTFFVSGLYVAILLLTIPLGPLILPAEERACKRLIFRRFFE